MSEQKTKEVQIEESAKTTFDGVDNALLDHDAYIRARNLTLQQKRPFLQAVKESKKAIAICLCMQVAIGILGTEIIMVASLVGNQAFVRVMGGEAPIDGVYHMPAWVLSLWAGIWNIVLPIGMFFGGWFTDRFGRLPTMYLAPSITLIGVVIEIVSPNRNIFIVAKIVMGFASGVTQSVIPAYVAEIAPREVRGIMIGGGYSLFFNTGALVGTLVAYAGNQAFPSPMDNHGWRVPLYVGLAIPIMTLVLQFFLLRESPYWLALHDNLDEAKKSLRFINPSKSETEIQELTDMLVYTIGKEKKDAYDYRNSTFFDLFKGHDLRRTFVACFPNIGIQMAGNMLQSSYSTYFFTLAGVHNALLGSCVVTSCGVAGAIAAFFVLEFVGRWPMVFWGLVFETITMIIIAAVNSSMHGNINTAGGWVLVICCAIFNFVTAFGPGLCGHAYAGEAGSARLRAKTTAFALLTNGLLGGIWQIVLPYELDRIGPNTGYMFFGFGIICILVVYFYLPELGGLTYAQMDELFQRKIPARKFNKTECTGTYGLAMENNEKTINA